MKQCSIDFKDTSERPLKVYGSLGYPTSGDGEVWSIKNWQGEPSESLARIPVADLYKKSKSMQFHGLMGRSSGASQPIRMGRKRNKGEMFVGLMGRRSSSGESQEKWSNPHYY
ncbi:hypothetical protein UPYG_G00100900 [Umbra pygmaea]|uniref:Uncharacterized protein n=1 Tax=Umbra pygmaea TaxID=75934 RepID=A0ABD0X4K3_UMBPY